MMNWLKELKSLCASTIFRSSNSGFIVQLALKQKSWEYIILHLFIVNIDKNERVYQTRLIGDKAKGSGKITETAK